MKPGSASWLTAICSLQITSSVAYRDHFHLRHLAVPVSGNVLQGKPEVTRLSGSQRSAVYGAVIDVRNIGQQHRNRHGFLVLRNFAQGILEDNFHARASNFSITVVG